MNVVEVNWFGLDLLEPMTGFTDLIVALFCFFFGNKLYRKSKEKISKYWSVFFWVMGSAALVGGVAHIFLNYLGENVHLVSRSLTVFGVFSAELGSYLTLSNKNLKKGLTFFSVIKGLATLVMLFVYNEFIFVKINSVIGLVGIVLIIHLVPYFKSKYFTGTMLLTAVGFGVIAATVNTFKLSPHDWFTYHDVSHFLMIASFYYFFKGVSDSDYISHSVIEQKI